MSTETQSPEQPIDSRARWSRRRFVQVAAGAGAVASFGALLAACGGGGSAPTATSSTSAGGTGGGTATTGAGTPAAGATPGGTTGTAQQGGTLTYATNEEPDTLNPYITQLVVGNDVLSLFMESLLQPDDKGEYGPRLAESFEVASDGLTYTFKLRQGVKWHDGSDFTAKDVVDTYNMIMNKDFGAFSQQGWEKIDKIETPDDHTVVMKLKEVFAPFTVYVGGAYISPSSALGKGPQSFKQDFGRNPFGTGPFKFVEWKSGDHIAADANPDYWGGKPKLDKVVVKIVPDSNTITVQLKSGEADLGAYLDAQQYDTYTQIADKTVVEKDSQAWFHLDLKNIDFLMEKPVRQALDFATPKQQIIDKILKGHATISVADIAPISWAYNPNIQPRPYDIEQAKKLLDEAGWKPGSDGIREKNGKKMSLELWGIQGDQQNNQILQVIAASWKQIGVNAQLKFQDIKTLWGPEGYQFTKTPTACGYSWFNSNDPDDTFYWNSSQIPSTPTGTGGNLPAYFNKYSFQQQIDDLTNRGVKTVDKEERKKIYWQIQELLHEEVPVIFIYWGKLIFVAPKKLVGFNPNAFTSLFYNVKDWGYTA